MDFIESIFWLIGATSLLSSIVMLIIAMSNKDHESKAVDDLALYTTKTMLASGIIYGLMSIVQLIIS